jgi:hypothetical protein
MKKPLSAQTLAKEAAFWEQMKKGAKNPGTVCHK